MLPSGSHRVPIIPGLVGLAACRMFYPWEALARPKPIHFAICFAVALVVRSLALHARAAEARA